MRKYPTYLNLPRQQPIEQRGQPTEWFGRLYKQQRRRLLEVYPLGSASWKYGKPHPHTGERTNLEPPPQDPAEFIQKRFMPSHEREQLFTTELAAHLLWLEQHDWQSHGFKLRDDQQADLFAVLCAIPPGVRDAAAAVLLRKCTGGGKTPEVGELNYVELRCQDRRAEAGKDPGIGMYVTARTTHLHQQTLSRVARILASPPYTTPNAVLNRYRRELAKHYKHDDTDPIGQAFDPHAWRELFSENHEGCSGLEVVQRSLEEHSRLALWKNLTGDRREQVEQEIASLIDGQRVMLLGLYRTPDFLRPVPRPEGGKAEDALAAYSGDASFRIPRDCPVLATRKKLQLHELEGRPRFIFGPASMITGVASQERYKQEYAHVDYVAVDEAKATNPNTWAQPFAGAPRPPIRILLTGADRHIATGLGPLERGKSTFARTTELTVPEAVEREILASVAFGLLNGADEQRYSPGTEEAWEAFVMKLFQPVKLLKGQKQAWERNLLVAVPPKLIRECGHRHQRALAEKGYPGKVVCYDGKLADAGGDREIAELWFSNREDDPENLPHIFYTSATNVWALSLGGIEMGVALDALNEEHLRQFFGRVTHADGHRTGAARARREFRVLFWQYFFRGTDPRLLLPRLLDERGTLPEGDVPWTDGQRILPLRRRREDERRSRGRSFRKERKLLPALDHAVDRGFTGTPMELTAPTLTNPLEVKLYNTPAKNIHVEEVLAWAESYNSGLYRSYSTVLKLRAQEVLAETARRRGATGAEVIAQLRRKMHDLENRFGGQARVYSPDEDLH